MEGFIEHYGVDYSLDQRDEYGHSPAHWMALNGHTHVCRSFPFTSDLLMKNFLCRYLMTKKVAKIDLHSNNGQGPRPIHWASRFYKKPKSEPYKTFHRNGHVAVVDTLLTAGVPVDATDHKGLTPLMMACMFGRSMMSAYLLGKVRNKLRPILICCPGSSSSSDGHER